MQSRILFAALVFVVPLLAGCATESNDPAAPAPSVDGGVVTKVGGSVDQVVTAVFPGKYNFTGPYSRVLSPGSLKILPAERVEIPSPLGTGSIEMGLHLPDTKEKVPILVFASPYFFAEGSPGGARTVLDRTPNSSFYSLIENFVPHGYAVVAVAVRGTAGSDGCNDLMGPDEIDDLDAAITWLGEQEWSSGAIAMTGVSYDGSTPWSVAARGNPYLKTIIPISGVPDIYGLMYRNGSSEQRGPLLLNALYIEGSYASGTPADIPSRICPEAYEGLALSAAAGVLGVDPTGYWQARNRKPAVEANYKGSVLSVQGLQDWNVDPSQVIPWVDDLDQMGLRTKQMLGQWGHAWPDGIGTDGANTPATRADWKEILLRWMDQELKGLDVDTGAPVQVRDDQGRWRNELHYPPRDTNWTTYQLNQGLLTAETGPAESNILYPQHTAFQTASSLTCMVSCMNIPPDFPDALDVQISRAADFTLGVQETDLLVVGLPKVHVTVTPHGPGGYMGATLIDRDENGTDRFMGWTSMNLAFADGTTERTEVIPGEPLLVKMEIQPMDGVVKAGHQLILRLWVIADRDRLGGQPGTVALETGGSVQSILALPTVTRGPDVYFTPPIGPEGSQP